MWQQVSVKNVFVIESFIQENRSKMIHADSSNNEASEVFNMSESLNGIKLVKNPIKSI